MIKYLVINTNFNSIGLHLLPTSEGFLQFPLTIPIRKRNIFYDCRAVIVRHVSNY